MPDSILADPASLQHDVQGDDAGPTAIKYVLTTALAICR